MFNPIAKLKATKNHGESFKDVFSYWLPELISATILISLPPVFDAWVITRLGSTTLYGALGMGNQLLTHAYQTCRSYSGRLHRHHRPLQWCS